MKFIDLFAGMGGMRKGFEQACEENDIKPNCVFTSEIKPQACAVLNQNNPNDAVSGDITKIPTLDIPDFDVLLGGFPCFDKGTLITTSEGLKNIEDINSGDLVLTHKNKFKEVVVPMVKYKKGIYNLSIQGIPDTKVTEEHPYYVRESNLVWDNDKRTYVKKWTEPKWIPVKDLKPDKHFIGFSQNNNAINKYSITNEEAWFLGNYIAGGYLQDGEIEDTKQHKVVFFVSKYNIDIFESKLNKLKAYKEQTNAVYKVTINSERLAYLAKKCGIYFGNKVVPDYIMDLQPDLLKEVLDGYLLDTVSVAKDTYRVTTTSKKLVYTLGQSVQKVYKRPYTIKQLFGSENQLLDNTIVKQKEMYTISFNLGAESLSNAAYIDGMLWNPVKSKVYLSEWEGNVYNFEVEDDNSYVANNSTVHNCQSFSTAGKKLGFEDTRGTLFFEIARILKDKQPKGFILENVEGLVIHDRENTTYKIGRTLKTILTTLNDLGYKVSWEVINAKDFNLPQNRKRVFIVGSKKKEPNLKDYIPRYTTLEKVLDVDVEIPTTPFSDLLQRHFKTEELIGKQISDKRGGKNNIHSWDFSYKGIVSDDEKELLNRILQERRKKKWASEIGISWMDGMPLTKKQIETFYTHNQLDDMLEKLVEFKYLKLEHPKRKVGSKRVEDKSLPKGYNIVAGQLSFPIRKILDPSSIAPTLVATDMDRLYVPDNGRIRPLTLTESLRLCGYPEDFKFDVSLRDGYDLIGNTVAVPVVKHVATKLLEVL